MALKLTMTRETVPALGPLVHDTKHLERLALRSVAAYVAHEINHPLGTISNLTSVALRRISDPVVRPSELTADLEAIKAETRRAADVIRNLRLLAGGIHGSSQMVGVQLLLHEAVARFQRRLPRGAVRVMVRCPDKSLTVRGAAELLHIALHNLFVNSAEALLEASIADPRIILRATRDGADWVVIRVIDNGPGVPEGVKGRLFEPFVSGKEGGSGLGLAIARDVIEWHYGTIEYVDKSTRPGACFHIRLVCRNSRHGRSRLHSRR